MLEDGWLIAATTSTLILSCFWLSKSYFDFKCHEEENTRSLTTTATNEEEKVNAQRTSVMSSSKSNNVVYPGGPLSVYFGSQTGTAESFAKILVEEGKTQGFDTRLKDLEDFDPTVMTTEEGAAIFLMATYGEGDPTDNTVEFYEWLVDKEGTLSDTAVSPPLSTVAYTVFGLGNRQYEQYNKMGRFVNERFETLGAKRIYHYGEGDDDGTLEEDFENWKEHLWKTLRQVLLGESEEEVVAKESSINVVTDKQGGVPSLHCDFSVVKVRPTKKRNGGAVKARVYADHEIQTSNKHYFDPTVAKVVVSRELRQSTALGSTLHIEFDISHSPLTYTTADNLAVLADNDPVAVQTLAAHLNVSLDMVFTLEPTSCDQKIRFPFPTPCTVSTALTQYLDLGQAPRRALLGQLAPFATDVTERARCTFLASKDGREAYHQTITEACVTITSCLVCLFPSIKLTLCQLITLLPSLQPRLYTISSCHWVHPTRLHITVSVLATKTPVFHGLCSTFLSTLVVPDKNKSNNNNNSITTSTSTTTPRLSHHPWPSARLFVRPSTFKLPSDPLTPLLLIGPGTGIAPLRAFLQARTYQRDVLHQLIGPTVLYFGCAKATSDYIYKAELASYVTSGVLTSLHVAFSRDQDTKCYVQHLMVSHAETLEDLITTQRASIYVCGATRMGQGVHDALVSVLSRQDCSVTITENHPLSEAEAVSTLRTMTENGTYIQELWS